MRKSDIRRILENKGYKVMTCQNSYIAVKNNCKYMAESLNGLYNKIMK